MKYSVTSENTKRMFAEALKRALKKKSLSKITVKELVAECGVNHKTFYYHFRDIYDLVHWMLERETVDVVNNINLLTDYEDAIRYILAYVRDNNYILNCLFDSMGKQQFSAFFYGDFISLLHVFVDFYIDKYHYVVEEEYIEFLCSFYAKALAEILIDWLKKKETLPEEKLIAYVVSTFHVSVLALLEHASQERE